MGFGHSAAMPYLLLLVETDCVPGVVGLELGNPSGAKSGRVAASISGNRPKMRRRDCSRLSCGVKNMQLRQGLARRAALRPCCSTCLGDRIRTAKRPEKKAFVP